MDSAQREVNESRWQECVVRLQQIEETAYASDFDRFKVSELLAYCAQRAGNNAVASAALEDSLRYPDFSDVERLGRTEILAQLWFLAADFKSAANAAGSAISLGSGDDEIFILLIDSLVNLERFPEARSAAEQWVSLREQARAELSEPLLDKYLYICVRLNDPECSRAAIEKLVVFHPSERGWRSYLSSILEGAEKSEIQKVARLAHEFGIRLEPSDYTFIGSYLIDEGFAAESVIFLETAIANKLLRDARYVEAASKILARGKIAAESELRTLIRREEEAAREVSGAADFKVGRELIFAGEPRKAIAVIERGLAKGQGRGPVDALVSLGIARLRLGDASASAAFLQLGDEGLEKVLKRAWILASEVRGAVPKRGFAALAALQPQSLLSQEPPSPAPVLLAAQPSPPVPAEPARPPAGMESESSITPGLSEPSAAERRRAEKLAAEQRRIEEREADRLAKLQREAERKESARIAEETRQAERLAGLQREAERREAERVAVEALRAERLAAVQQKAEAVEAERVAREQRKAEQREKDRLVAERREAERVEAERRRVEEREAQKMVAQQRVTDEENRRLAAVAKTAQARERELAVRLAEEIARREEEKRQLVAAVEAAAKRQQELEERLKRETQTVASIPAAAASGASASRPARRFALAIGNNSYRSIPSLEKAVNDAVSVANGLKKIGYETTVLVDATQRQINSAVNRFVRDVAEGGQGVLFYAGHGIQINNQNFLLPVDFDTPTTELDVLDQSVSLQVIQDKLIEARAKFALLILDACRDNPLPRRYVRSLGGTRGLAQASSADGQMVVFSAGANQQALDKLGEKDPNPNGLFTRELLPWFDRDNVSIRSAILEVRRSVNAKAREFNHQQTPAVYDQVLGDFFFR